MADYDDLFNSANDVPEDTGISDVPPPDDNFDKDAWAAQKKQERDEIYALIDQTALKLPENPDAIKEYLDIQSRFNLYSVGNLLLIQAQMPTAVKLKDYDAWKAAGTTVRRKQQAVSLLEPGKPYKRDDGSIGTSYNVKKVFDISQTYAKSAQKPPAEIDRTVIKALMSQSPAQIVAVDEFSDDMRELNAYYDEGNNQIVILKGLDAPEIFRCLAEQIAFAKFYCNDGLNAGSASFMGQSVSYVLCRQYGADMSNFVFDTIPYWIKSDNTQETTPEQRTLLAQEIRAELTGIHDMVNSLNERIREVSARAKPVPEQEAR
jgi:hypothetical protein